MLKLDRHDMQAIQDESCSEWEFRHPGIRCPFNATLKGMDTVPDDELAFEINMQKELSPWA